MGETNHTYSTKLSPEQGAYVEGQAHVLQTSTRDELRRFVVVVMDALYQAVWCTPMSLTCSRGPLRLLHHRGFDIHLPAEGMPSRPEWRVQQ